MPCWVLLFLMTMSMMDIWHVVVLMFFSGVYMFVRVCACYGGLMRVSGVIMPVAVFMEQGSMNMRMRMFFVDQQERANDHQNSGKTIRNRWRFSENDNRQ